ncbi:MAG: GWxTD domain-containing protein [Thermoanaerobaculia bacterium]
MRLAMCSVLAAVAASFSAWAASPAEALGQGRARIASGDCQGAIAILQDAIPQAIALTPEKTKAEALGAIHFYSALAFANCRQADKAKDSIRQFLRVHPGHSALDASKYPRQFIELFEEVQRNLADGGATAFSHYYPDYGASTDSAVPRDPLTLWGASSEFQLLADDSERDKWPTLRDDEARARFIESFWSRRDPIREELSRRIAYADRAWGSEFDRGSLSDRGKVFVFLGVPARVYTKPLLRSDGAFIPSRSPIEIEGILERWVYFKDQFPSAIHTTSVEFRFISQPGYGDHVMQKDFWPMKALAEARKNTLLQPE